MSPAMVSASASSGDSRCSRAFSRSAASAARLRTGSGSRRRVLVHGAGQRRLEQRKAAVGRAAGSVRDRLGLVPGHRPRALRLSPRTMRREYDAASARARAPSDRAGSPRRAARAGAPQRLRPARRSRWRWRQVTASSAVSIVPRSFTSTTASTRPRCASRSISPCGVAGESRGCDSPWPSARAPPATRRAGRPGGREAGPAAGRGAIASAALQRQGAADRARGGQGRAALATSRGRLGRPEPRKRLGQRGVGVVRRWRPPPRRARSPPPPRPSATASAGSAASSVQVAAHDGLVQLGQLARHRRRRAARAPRPCRPGWRASREAPSNRTSVARTGASVSEEGCAARPTCGGGKPANRKRSVGRPAALERRQRRRGAGDREHRAARGDRLAHQPIAGIGDQRRAGVGDQARSAPPPASAASTFGRARAAGMLVVALEAAWRCRRPPSSLAGDAGVLGQHQVGAGQHVERAQRDVAQVPDRRRDQIEAGRQRARR